MISTREIREAVVRRRWTIVHYGGGAVAENVNGPPLRCLSTFFVPERSFSLQSATATEFLQPVCCRIGRPVVINCKGTRAMSELQQAVETKKLVRIDVTSDTVCPWCYVGKKYLEKAIEATKDEYDFEVRWHPFLLNPNAPIEGIDKLEYYKMKFGEGRVAAIVGRVTKVFNDVGVQFKFGGLTGNTLDSHRLIELAGRQGYDKQNALVDEFFRNYFTEEKYLGDRQVLLDAAEKVGIKGAKEFLEDPNAGLKEVQKQLRKYASGVTGVPYFLINGRYQLSGAQPPSSFLEAFEHAGNYSYQEV